MDEGSQFFDTFITEAGEMLKELSDKTMVLESNLSDRAALNSLFRICHSLKGDASFFGLISTKTITHRMEDLLSQAVATPDFVDKPFIELFWEGVKLLYGNIEVVKVQKVPQAITTAETEFLARIDRKMHEVAKKLSVPLGNCRATDTERFFVGNTDVSRAVFVVRGFFEKARTSFVEAKLTESFIAQVTELKSVFVANGGQNQAEIAQKMLADFETMVDDSGCPDAFLTNLLEENFRILMESVQRTEIQIPVSAGEKASVPSEKDKPTFRIEEEKIDEILNAVHKSEEAKKSLGRIRNQLIQAQVPNELVLEFQKTLNELNFLFRDILQMLIRIKVVSPRLLLEKLGRIIVALAKSCDKKIKVVTEGNDVFVERGKIEVLEEILPHIVRNCIDHGIESSEERVRLGKPEEGLVAVKVNETDGALVVTVSDDGRGIDYERVRGDACRKGLITDEELNNLSDEDSTRLLFISGVTTSKSVTEISGRGVGLDVVLNRIAKIGGRIDIKSEPGQGSTFIITLPINKVY